MLSPSQTTTFKKQDTTLSGQTTDALREAIILGEIKPGSKLNEPQLSQQYQVSRGPLREAIRRLVAMGLIKHVPHQGATVITFELENVMELYDVREALEGKSAALAAKNMSDLEIKELYNLMNIHRRHFETNSSEYIQAESDFDFHYQVINSCGNKMLINQLCDELYHLIRMFRYQTGRFKTRSNGALIEHQQLIYAIEQRDSEMAELVMRHHIVRAKESIRKHLMNKEERINH